MEKVTDMPVMPKKGSEEIVLDCAGAELKIKIEIPAMSTALGIAEDIANRCVYKDRCHYMAIDTIYVSSVLHLLSDMHVSFADEDIIDLDTMYVFVKETNILDKLLNIPVMLDMYNTVYKRINDKVKTLTHSSSKVDHLIDELEELGNIMTDEKFLHAIDNANAMNDTSEKK